MEEIRAIGYVAITNLVDVGEKGIVESGKKIVGKKISESCYKADKGCIIVGRKHSGDENGYTYYKTGKPVIVPFNNQKVPDNLSISLAHQNTTDGQKQSRSNFLCEGNYAIIGRTHEGDENGQTSLTVAELIFTQGGESLQDYEIKTQTETVKVDKEDSGKWATLSPEPNVYLPMTGMQHVGDENGKSIYTFTYFTVYPKVK